MSLPVMSSLLPPHARDLGISFGGSCLRSRIYSTQCFFGCIATHARGLGRSLRFTHAQTNSVTSTAKGLGLKRANRWPLSDWSIFEVTWTNWRRFQCKWVTWPQKTIALLSFSRSHWLGPSWAMYTTVVHRRISVLASGTKGTERIKYLLSRRQTFYRLICCLKLKAINTCKKFSRI